MKKYTSKNKYYKYYNKYGKSCRIKFSKEFYSTPLNEIGETPFNIIIKFKKDPADAWMYHSPDIQFENIFEIIKYICRNTENDKIIFKVIPSLTTSLTQNNN